MKKFFIYLFVFFIFLISFIGFLFTPLGNSLIKTIVENEINSKSPVKIYFEKFRVSFNTFNIKADFLNNSYLLANGKYSIFNQNFDLNYTFHINNLKDLESLISYPLRGSFNTYGNVKGSLEEIKINGKSDFSKSDTAYFVDIKNKKVSKVLADINHLDLENLLFVLNKAEFVKGKFYSKIELNSVDINNLDGKIKAYVKNAIVNRDLMKREYNISLPPTKINLQAAANLNGKKIDFFLNLFSNLAKIDFKGIFENNYLNSVYHINIDNLSLLTPLINQKIRGEFKTNGRVKGTLEELKIKGFSDLAKSNTTYFIKIQKNKIQKITTDIKNLDVAYVLYMVNQPSYINGKFNSDIVLNSLDFDNLKGKIAANLDAKLNSKTLKKDFNITLPSVKFNVSSNVILNGKKIDLFVKLISDMLKANINGKFENNYLNLDYNLVNNLSLFSDVINQKIRGMFKTKGKVKGDLNSIFVNGVADIAGGNINYNLNLASKDLEFKAKNIRIQKLLYMIYQPTYSYGDIISDGRINFDNSLKGKISLLVKGKTDKNVLYKEFNFTDAEIVYKLDSSVDIKNNLAYLKANFKSDVADAVLYNGIYDLNKSIFKADYKVDIPNLDKLYFATKKHLKGNIKINGKIKKAKELIITGFSKVLDGEVNYKLLNNIFTLSAKDLSFIKLLDMLMYPKIFDSKANANLKYDLAIKKGKLNASLINGHFLPNKLTSLVKKFAHFDLTKEMYEKTILHTDIKDKKLINDLYMKSPLTVITSKRALIDLEKEYVNAKMKIEISKRPVIVRIKGNLFSPSIKLDLKEYFKSVIKDKKTQKAIDKIKRKIEEKIKSKIEKKLNLKDIFHF